MVNKDDHLIYEAFESKFTQQISAEISVAKNLMKMDDALHEMSTVIHMSKSSQIDQLLSRIRDTVEMLMSERGSGTAEDAEEDIENTEDAYNKGEEEHYKNKEENLQNVSLSPQGAINEITPVQDILIKKLKKHGFKLVKVSNKHAEQEGGPTVFMNRNQNASKYMHDIVEISPVGHINGGDYKEFLDELKGEENEEGDDEEGDLMTHMKERGMIPRGAKVTLSKHETEEQENVGA